MFDALQRLVWVAVCAHAAPEHHPPQPDPLPRPGIEPPEEISFIDRMRSLAALGG